MMEKNQEKYWGEDKSNAPKIVCWSLHYQCYRVKKRGKNKWQRLSSNPTTH